MNILVLEDDDLTRISMESMLSTEGKVTSLRSLQELPQNFEQYQFDLVFLDLDVDDQLDGLDLLKKYKQNFKYIVVVSGHEENEIIKSAYEAGCNDYLVKPFSPEELQGVLKRKASESSDYSLEELIQSELSFSLNEQVRYLSKNISQVQNVPSLLLTGETGTGKTLLAKFIHRKFFSGPFMHINCAEIPESLIESELFGHRKGAFTGADTNKEGRLSMANGGVLFLDEITSLSTSLQRKLLSAIEEKEFFAVGDDKKTKSEFFLITATCDNISELMTQTLFRADLYFRISAVEIEMPSLRDRKTDILKLVEKFISKGRRVAFDQDALEKICLYSWPGNIRELQNTILSLKSQRKGVINASDLPEKILNYDPSSDMVFESREQIIKEAWKVLKRDGLSAFTSFLERELTELVLNRNSRKVRKTIKELKISNSSFYRIKNN